MANNRIIRKKSKQFYGSVFYHFYTFNWQERAYSMIGTNSANAIIKQAENYRYYYPREVTLLCCASDLLIVIVDVGKTVLTSIAFCKQRQ